MVRLLEFQADNSKKNVSSVFDNVFKGFLLKIQINLKIFVLQLTFIKKISFSLKSSIYHEAKHSFLMHRDHVRAGAAGASAPAEI